ncbi:efflux RND transporter periplasmic adaptor subunit [Halothiobacillus sp. DCM-1]|uniref:efflux RND transporter periplasmic adaptor subunit n=1 Tax=Halothiobacillus sp. DCM-1 TaxID=3112558 RepID=UPI00324D0725
MPYIPEPLSWRMRRLRLAAIPLLAAAWCCPAVQAKPAMPAPIVPVMRLAPQTVTVYAHFTGTTAANRLVTVRAQTGGILLKREFVEGDLVRAGQPLFSLDDRPYVAALNEAKAAVAAAKANRDAAARDNARISTLFAKGVASTKERDDAQSALEVANAAVALAQAKQASAEVTLGYTRITAPISGIAGLRQVAVGNLIKTDDALVEIDAIDPIQVLFTTSADNPYAQTPALNPSATHPVPITLTADGLAQPMSGELNFRATAIDPQTNSIRFRATVPNPEGRLKPNAFVQISLAVEQRPQAIVIPPTAITTGIRPGSFAVYTVNPAQEVSLVPVTLGPLTPQGQLIDQGLTAGETIVTDGLVKLRPGIKIEPAKDAAKTAP